MSAAGVFQVRAEVPVAEVVTHAGGLLRGLRELAMQGVERGGMDANACFVFVSSLEVAVALVDTIERRAAA
jgi:hypothetical protein